jgi:hypothetical protein
LRSKSEPLGFKRNGSSATEWIADVWLHVTDGQSDLFLSVVEKLLVNGVLPYNQPLDEPKKAVTFAILIHLGWKAVRSR